MSSAVGLELSQDVRAGIRARRDQLGLTQAELAHISGLSVSNWTALESGRRTTCRPGTARAMSAALGWTPDSIERLARGEEPVEAPARAPAPPGAVTSANVAIDNLPPGLAASGDLAGTLRDHPDELLAVIRRALILQEEMAKRLGITLDDPAG